MYEGELDTINVRYYFVPKMKKVNHRAIGFIVFYFVYGQNRSYYTSQNYNKSIHKYTHIKIYNYIIVIYHIKWYPI